MNTLNNYINNYIAMFDFLREYSLNFSHFFSGLSLIFAILVLINKNHRIISILSLLCLFLLVSSHLILLGMSFADISNFNGSTKFLHDGLLYMDTALGGKQGIDNLDFLIGLGLLTVSLFIWSRRPRRRIHINLLGDKVNLGNLGRHYPSICDTNDLLGSNLRFIYRVELLSGYLKGVYLETTEGELVYNIVYTGGFSQSSQELTASFENWINTTFPANPVNPFNVIGTTFAFIAPSQVYWTYLNYIYDIRITTGAQPYIHNLIPIMSRQNRWVYIVSYPCYAGLYRELGLVWPPRQI